MKKSFLILFIISLSVSLFAKENNRIKWIRYHYNYIENSIKENRFYKKTKSTDDGNYGTEATLYIDDFGRVRKYYLSRGSEDSVMTAEYYYDREGRMFFSFLHYGNVREQYRDIRSYYDKDGHLIKRTLDATTDLQISYYYRIKNPKKNFRDFDTD